jgi:GxxExxY protein
MNRHDATNATDATKSENFLNEPDREVDCLAELVLDAAFTVHRSLGPGFLESVYEEAMAIELRLLSVAFERQVLIPIEYRGLPAGQVRLDLLVGGELIVELKAVDAFASIHVAQALSYLKATQKHLALLLNFNVTEMRRGIRRIVSSSRFSRGVRGVRGALRGG